MKRNFEINVYLGEYGQRELDKIVNPSLHLNPTLHFV
jgi:hypothetical protein